MDLQICGFTLDKAQWKNGSLSFLETFRTSSEGLNLKSS